MKLRNGDVVLVEVTVVAGSHDQTFISFQTPSVGPTRQFWIKNDHIKQVSKRSFKIGDTVRYYNVTMKIVGIDGIEAWCKEPNGNSAVYNMNEKNFTLVE